MTNDPVEEFFLAEVEKYRHRDASTIKLVALVRIYREANQFYIDKNSEPSAPGDWFCADGAQKACTAEQKALEIVK